MPGLAGVVSTKMHRQIIVNFQIWMARALQASDPPRGVVLIGGHTRPIGEPLKLGLPAIVSSSKKTTSHGALHDSTGMAYEFEFM